MVVPGLEDGEVAGEARARAAWEVDDGKMVESGESC